MRKLRYLLHSLIWFRWTNAAIVAGAAICAAVLGGALLVGYSVRSSLRDIALARLGNSELALVSSQFLRMSLASDFMPEFRAAPLISLAGVAVHAPSGARASQVTIYGVDDSFFTFHGFRTQAPSGRAVWLSPALTREFNAKPKDGVLLRVEEPSDIPREFLHGRRDNTARTLRFSVADSVVAPVLGDFSLRPSQGELRAVFVSLDQLARELGQTGKANTILLAGGNEERAVIKLHEHFRLEDLGLRFRDLGNERGVALEHVSTLLDDTVVDHALSLGKTLKLLQRPVFTWLANSIRVGKREIPYSLVAGVDEATLAEINHDRPLPDIEGSPIVLNQWSATDLGAKVGDKVTLKYFIWSSEGHLKTEQAEFVLAAIAPLSGLAADRTFTPEYPGITDKATLTAWDPPFPIDRQRIHPLDEQYWHLHRATPKAWISLNRAKDLWSTRYGSLTSIRYPEPSPELVKMLRAELDPMEGHFALLPVRQQALSASSGSTDFGEYFLYFSFFVIVSAMLLMGLFFRLGVEQRQREVGLLSALGFNQREIRGVFQSEGAVLAVAGCALGVPLGAGYAALILHGLRTWWIGATGASMIALHLNWPLLVGGAAAGLPVAALAIWATLRGWQDLTPRGLMAGPGRPRGSRLRAWMIAPPLGLAVSLLLAAAAGAIGAPGSFFGSGILLLASGLMVASLWLRRPSIPIPVATGFKPLLSLAARNAGWRPGRSMFCVALVAAASFLLVSIESFRHAGQRTSDGYTLYAESSVPLVANPNTREGRESLNLSDLPPRTRWTRFRLRPGNDVSCLNLYLPQNPRVLGASEEFLKKGAFRFAGSLAASPETERNPWLLLDAQLNAGIIPAIVDETSMQDVLHKRLGEIVEVERPGAAPLKFRLVAALRDSLFQGELIISERDFVRLFPEIEGHRVFLIQGAPAIAPGLEDALSDYGLDAVPTADRLAAYHRVNDTYISTFQALGALGLLLGTFGMAAVLLRNTLERRRELALLRATGFAQRDIRRVLLLENLALLFAGLSIGAVCALLAIAPVLVARQTVLPVLGIAGLMLVILASGALATWLAVLTATHAPMTESLRAE